MIESAEQFRDLRESDDPCEYRRAAQEEASLEVWLDVISRMPDLRCWVAQNKTVPIAILELLADDPDSRVRWMVASKRKLPESLQLKIAADSDPSIRATLARNPKATERVLKILAHDVTLLVRDAVSLRK